MWNTGPTFGLEGTITVVTDQRVELLLKTAGSATQATSGSARVLAVFRYLASTPDGATLKEVADALGSPKTSIHRALSTLRKAGLVAQSPVGRYRYSHDLFRLVFGCYEGIDETARIRPVLDRLARRFGEATHYAVLDGPDVVYLGKIQAPSAGLRISSVIGGRNPAHCTGVGKVLLASSLRDEESVDAFVRAHGPLVRRTDNTIVEPSLLADELKLIRSRSYAVDKEESEPGINCVAVAVFLGPNADPSGAVSVTALARRMPLAALEEKVPEIQSIIAEELGSVLA